MQTPQAPTQAPRGRLAKQLWARFDALPVDTARVRKHIQAGHVALGDFMQQYDALMQAEVLTRPAGRSTLARGDTECYTATDGARCAWEVAAVVDGTAYLTVGVTEPGRKTTLYSVTWPPLGPDPAPPACPALRELLADAPGARSQMEVAAWARCRHCLDLWDWTEDRCVAASDSGLPGDGVVARTHGDIAMAWQVETPEGLFAWTPALGVSYISRVSGKLPSAALINSLFARSPTLQDI